MGDSRRLRSAPGPPWRSRSGVLPGRGMTSRVSEPNGVASSASNSVSPKVRSRRRTNASRLASSPASCLRAQKIWASSRGLWTWRPATEPVPAYPMGINRAMSTASGQERGSKVKTRSHLSTALAVSRSRIREGLRGDAELVALRGSHHNPAWCRLTLGNCHREPAAQASIRVRTPRVDAALPGLFAAPRFGYLGPRGPSSRGVAAAP
jgi:hypothetical protein